MAGWDVCLVCLWGVRLIFLVRGCLGGGVSAVVWRCLGCGVLASGVFWSGGWGVEGVWIVFCPV